MPSCGLTRATTPLAVLSRSRRTLVKPSRARAQLSWGAGRASRSATPWDGGLRLASRWLPGHWDEDVAHQGSEDLPGTSCSLPLGLHAINPDNQSIQSDVLEFSWVGYPNRPQLLLACWCPLIWPIMAALPRPCLVTGSFISGLCGVQTLSDRDCLVKRAPGDACFNPTQQRPNYQGRSGQDASRRSPHRNVKGKTQLGPRR